MENYAAFEEAMEASEVEGLKMMAKSNVKVEFFGKDGKASYESAEALRDFAYIFVENGEMQQAKKYYEEALQQFREITHAQPHEEVVETLNQLALVMTNVDIVKAKEYNLEAVFMCRQLEARGNFDRTKLGMSLAFLGTVHQMIAENKEASACMREAVVIFASIEGNEGPMVKNLLAQLQRFESAPKVHSVVS